MITVRFPANVAPLTLLQMLHSIAVSETLPGPGLRRQGVRENLLGRIADAAIEALIAGPHTVGPAAR
jgi:hypothetical protein